MIDEEPGRKLQEKAWGIVLSSMHFNPTPATPLACSPVSKKNLRGWLHKTVAPNLKGGMVYSGENIWCVEGMGTEHLATVMRRMIALRGGKNDTENITKLCRTKKFWNSPMDVQQATLEKYFDLDYLFSEFDSKTLPSRYLRTYCAVEKTWDRPAWKEPYIIKP